MTNAQRDLELMQSEFERREPGVADMMEFYEKIEAIYFKSVAATTSDQDAYPSDWLSNGQLMGGLAL